MVGGVGGFGRGCPRRPAAAPTPRQDARSLGKAPSLMRKWPAPRPSDDNEVIVAVAVAGGHGQVVEKDGMVANTARLYGEEARGKRPRERQSPAGFGSRMSGAEAANPTWPAIWLKQIFSMPSNFVVITKTMDFCYLASPMTYTNMEKKKD